MSDMIGHVSLETIEAYVDKYHEKGEDVRMLGNLHMITMASQLALLLPVYKKVVAERDEAIMQLVGEGIL